MVIKTGFKAYENNVKDGFFKNRGDAENYANELSFFGQGVSNGEINLSGNES